MTLKRTPVEAIAIDLASRAHASKLYADLDYFVHLVGVRVTWTWLASDLNLAAEDADNITVAVWLHDVI